VHTNTGRDKADTHRARASCSDFIGAGTPSPKLPRLCAEECDVFQRYTLEPVFVTVTAFSALN